MPGTGISPSEIEKVIGKTVAVDIVEEYIILQYSKEGVEAVLNGRAGRDDPRLTVNKKLVRAKTEKV